MEKGSELVETGLHACFYKRKKMLNLKIEETPQNRDGLVRVDLVEVALREDQGVNLSATCGMEKRW